MWTGKHGLHGQTGPNKVLCMRIDSSDAAAIYARACRAWYGKRALKVVNEQIRSLKRRGDTKGVAAWSKVADQVSELGASPKHSQRAAHGKLY